LILALRVDFDTRTVTTEAELHFHEPGAGPLDLDTRDLRIEWVRALNGAALPYTLAAPEPILGARLRIELPAGSHGVRIASPPRPGPAPCNGSRRRRPRGASSRFSSRSASPSTPDRSCRCRTRRASG
jgi:hypothetical protein